MQTDLLPIIIFRTLCDNLSDFVMAYQSVAVFSGTIICVNRHDNICEHWVTICVVYIKKSIHKIYACKIDVE